MSAIRDEWTTEDGSVRLLLGDCLEILPQIGKVDACVTDPPYGIGADKKNAHRTIRDNPNWDNIGWDSERPTLEAINAILCSAKDVAIWGGNYFADMLPASPAWLVWRKPDAESGFSLAEGELCWTNQKFALRMLTANRRDGNLHPTQKPVCVMEWTICQIGKPGLILDPFMGSGTTGIACIRLNRRFVGIEKEPKYFEIAKKRIQNELAKTALIETPKKLVQTSFMEAVS